MKRIVIISLLLLSTLSMSSQIVETLDIEKNQDGMFEQSVGSVSIKGEILNGKKTSTWTENHSNVDLPHYIIQYENGKKNGLYIEIDKNGYIVKKAEYQDDKLHGEICLWYRSGRLSKKQQYKNGVLDGKSVICYDKGYIQEEAEYKNGKRNGITIWYSYADKGQGPKAAMYTYQDGIFEGVQETYYEDGKLSSTKMFSNNVANGPSVEFYEDGSIKSEAIYEGGELKGKLKEYEKGKKFVD